MLCKCINSIIYLTYLFLRSFPFHFFLHTPSSLHTAWTNNFSLDNAIAQQQQESSTASTGDNSIHDDGGDAQQQPQQPPPPPQSDYKLFSKSIAKLLPANRKFASLTQLHQFMKLFMSFWDVPRLGTYSYTNSKRARQLLYLSIILSSRSPSQSLTPLDTSIL